MQADYKVRKGEKKNKNRQKNHENKKQLGVGSVDRDSEWCLALPDIITCYKKFLKSFFNCIHFRQTMEQNRKSRNQLNLDTGIFLYFREESDFSVNHAGTTE